MKKSITLLFFILTFSLLAQQSAQILGFRLAEGKSRVTIPFELNNNLIIIPVVINGQLPLRFVLDTGVRTAILTQKSYADILGLQYSRQYSIASPGGEHLLTAYVTNNISFFIPPGIQGNGHAMLVLEKDYLELRNFMGAEVHGVLGYELFSRFVVKINYQQKEVEVIDPRAFKPSKKMQTLDISVEDTKPYIRTLVDAGKKKELKLLIDTGASHGLLLDPESDSDIVVPEKNIKTIIGRALGGEITGKIGRIPSIELGKYQLQRVITSYPDPNSYMDTLKASFVKRNGSIGGEILNRFKVVFDYPHQKLYLQKNSAFKKEFQHNLSGITLKAKGSKLNVFEVSDVRGNSVADKAEIREGDLLIAINGTQTSTLDLNELNNDLNHKSGKRLTLLFDRGGEKIKKTLVLIEEI